jgi:hypothetical protein
MTQDLADLVDSLFGDEVRVDKLQRWTRNNTKTFQALTPLTYTSVCDMRSIRFKSTDKSVCCHATVLTMAVHHRQFLAQFNPAGKSLCVLFLTFLSELKSPPLKII